MDQESRWYSMFKRLDQNKNHPSRTTTESDRHTKSQVVFADTMYVSAKLDGTTDKVKSRLAQHTSIEVGAGQLGRLMDVDPGLARAWGGLQ